MLHALVGLLALTAMEIVLGIDNIVFITLAVGKLPKEDQARGRAIGLGLALIMRIALLLVANWIVHLKEPLFTLNLIGLSEATLKGWGIAEETAKHMNQVSVRDLVLLIGGLVLIKSAVREIHDNVEGHEHHIEAKPASFASIIMQIVFLDIIFSLDSVITAVGMAREIWVMIVAVIAAVGVMWFFSGTVAGFVTKHPTVKMLALSFLLLIGVMLLAEGIGTDIEKGYIYFAMVFSLVVEFLNLRMRSKKRAVQQGGLPS